jgi:hypothetical protein
VTVVVVIAAAALVLYIAMSDDQKADGQRREVHSRRLEQPELAALVAWIRRRRNTGCCGAGLRVRSYG